MRYHKWVKAEAVAPAAEDEKPAAWTLNELLPPRLPPPGGARGLRGGDERGANGPSANDGDAGPSASDALRMRHQDAFTAERTQLDKGFEVLAAVNAAAGARRALRRVRGRRRPSSRASGASRCSARTSTNGIAHSCERRLLLGRATKRRGLDGAAAGRRLYHGESHNHTRGKEQNARDFRNYCENQTPPKYPYLVELDDVDSKP